MAKEEKKVGKIDLSGIEVKNQFWAITLDDDENTLYLYNDKEEAINDFGDVFCEYPDASIAEIKYTKKGDKGSFAVDGVGWKEIYEKTVSKKG